MIDLITLVLKKDLGFSLEQEEQQALASMDAEKIKTVRKKILQDIQEKILPLDVLETVLEELKNTTYQKFLQSGGISLSVEEQEEQRACLENKCTRMSINISQGNSTEEDLLGPNIHETYGISMKN